MSVVDTNQIDIVSIDEVSASLVISDHLEWDGHTDDDHNYHLQEKINTYLRFYESGELYRKFPKAKGTSVRIEIVFQYKPNKSFEWFYDQIRPIVESAGLSLNAIVHGQPDAIAIGNGIQFES